MAWPPAVPLKQTSRPASDHWARFVAVGRDFVLGDLRLVETNVAAELQASAWQGQAAASDFAASASAAHRDLLTCHARATKRHEQEDSMME